MSALYRTYRPLLFGEVTGQEHIVTTLKQEVDQGRIGHAFLFSGPRGIGKTTIARIFAKAVNCEHHRNGEPCGSCPSCEDVQRGSLDIIEIDAASHTGVDHVRESILDASRVTPVARRYKVFIVDEAHMLSTSAWNALLKTLEEPPAHAIFILATTEMHKVPATIASRCQRFEFRRLAAKEIIARLENILKQEGVTVDPEVLSVIARASEGCLRDAESLLGQIIAVGGKKITRADATLFLPLAAYTNLAAWMDHVLHADAGSACVLTQQLLESGVDLRYFMDELTEYSRQLLLVSLGNGDRLDIPEEEKQTMLRLATNVKPATMVALADILIKRRQELGSTRIPSLPLELAAAEIALLVGGEVKKKIEPIASAGDVTIDQIKLSWGAVVERVGQESVSLPIMLSAALPLRVNDQTLFLGLKFALHSAKIQEAKNRAILEQALTEIMGASLKVQTEIVSEAITFPLGAPDEANTRAILESFGGRVIE